MVAFKLGILKVSVPKIKRNSKPKSDIVRTSNKMFTGKVIIDDDNDYAVTFRDDTGSDLVLKFTERSYELTGRRVVFSRNRDEHGNIIRYIRNKWDAKCMPGVPEKYVPFTKNWLVKGYIVRDHDTLKFDFKTLVGIEGYDVDTTNYEDE